MRKPDYILEEEVDTKRDQVAERDVCCPTLHDHTFLNTSSQLAELFADHERALDDALPPPLPRGYKTAADRARVLLVAAGFNPDEVPGARLPARRYRHKCG